MKITSQTRQQICIYFPAILWTLFIVTLVPLGSIVQIGGDEGMELMKAAVVFASEENRAQMWNDQPLTMTHMYSWCFRLFGVGCAAPRLVSVFCSAILLTAIALIVEHLTKNVWATVYATIYLVCAEIFGVLSLSAMQQLPSLALAMLGIGILVRWGEVLPRCTIALAAVSVGLAGAIKLTAAIYTLPAIAIICASRVTGKMCGEQHQGTHVWLTTRQVCMFLLICGGTLLLLLLIQGQAELSQLIGVHVRAYGRASGAGLFSQSGEPIFARFDYPEGLALAGLSLATVPCVAWRKPKAALIAVGPAVVAIGFNAAIQPWWSYYLLDLWATLSVPVGVFAAACHTCARHAFWRWRRSQHAISLASAVPGLLAYVVMSSACAKAPLRLQEVLQAQRITSSALVEKLQEYAARTRYVFAGPRLYAFHCGLLAPPELCVISQKRVAIGDIDVQEAINLIHRYRCEQVIISPEDRLIAEGLVSTYTLVGTYDACHLYIRNDLIQQSPHSSGETAVTGTSK